MRDFLGWQSPYLGDLAYRTACGKTDMCRNHRHTVASEATVHPVDHLVTVHHAHAEAYEFDVPFAVDAGHGGGLAPEQRAARSAAAFGDADDAYGAIGANGAQKTPESIAGTLLSRDGTYAFENGKVHNLESSDHVANHGDVAGREIANAIIAAMMTPG